MKTWMFITGLIVSFLLGWMLGVTGSNLPDRTYLELQNLSDGFHRLVITVAPMCFLGCGLCLVFHMIFRKKHQIAATLMAIIACVCSGGLGGSIGFIVQFDQTIEQKGMQGQLVMEWGSTEHAPPPRNETQTTSISLENGDIITLSDHMLRRKSRQGDIQWSRTLPGGTRGTLLLAGEIVLALAPGSYFQGDVMIAALRTDSGKPLWRFHCLGNQLHAAAISQGRLYYIAQRHTGASLGSIRLAQPTQRWAVAIDKALSAPARITPKGVEVAVGRRLLRFDKLQGTLVASIEACRHPEEFGVVCSGNTIQAFSRAADEPESLR